MSPLPSAVDLSQARAANRAPRLPELGPEPLPGFAIELVPPAVAEASEQFAEALARLDQAHAAAQRARDDVEKAAWSDRQAARDAAAVAESPPEATVPEAEKAAAEADRAVPAHEHQARVALDHFLGAIREHREAIDRKAQEREAEMADGLRRRIDGVADGLLALGGVRNLRGELVPGGTEGRHPQFAVRSPRRLPSKLSDPLAALRGQLVE